MAIWVYPEPMMIKGAKFLLDIYKELMWMAGDADIGVWGHGYQLS